MNFVFRTVAVLLIVPSFLFGCSIQTFSKPDSPDVVIKKFDQANKDKDIKRSKQYVDKEVLNAIETGKAWWIGTYANFINEYDKDTKKVKPIKNSTKIKGDTATIDVLITHPDNSQNKKTYYLVKEDNQWKITMDQ